MPGITPSKTLKVAELRTIHLHKLLDYQEDEVMKLVLACREVGFFYLDLTSSGSHKMLGNLQSSMNIMTEWFSQDLETKLKTETVSLSHGYKPTGSHAGVSQNRDGWEALKIGRFELNGRWALPSVVDQNLQLFSQLQDQCHFVTKVLLDRISSGLGIKGEHSLHKHHRDDEPSKSSLFFLHYPPVDETGDQGGQNMHTDIGSLTFLYVQRWGLQVLCPTTDTNLESKDKFEWRYVAPLPGHAVINVGDTLRFLTGYRLRSAMHRALQLETGDRYAIAYFLRPNDDAEFSDSTGVTRTAVDWYLKKNKTYESARETQQDAFLIGGMKSGI